ncbi:PfkB family carbohydrate kinase [Mycolicibacterium hippocampi]
MIGDLLRDVMVRSHVVRLNPEAPSVLMDALESTVTPGGAGNCAQYFASQRLHISFATACGPTDADITSELARFGVRVVPLANNIDVPSKTRYVVDGRVTARVDTTPKVAEIAWRHDGFAWLTMAIQQATTVTVSDYGLNCTLASPAVQSLVSSASADVPVVWDFHPRASYLPPQGVWVKFNLADFQTFATRVEATSSAAAKLEAVVGSVGRKHGWCGIVVTRGADGVVVWTHESTEVVPVDPIAIDVAIGAGDCFAACFAQELTSARGVDAAREAAATTTGYLALRDGRCAVPVGINASQLIKATRYARKTMVVASGCFDLLHAGHLDLLQAARDLGDVLVVLINSDASINRLKGSGRPAIPLEERSRVLRALRCVDAVVSFDEDTPCKALEVLRPDVYVKGSDYELDRLPERTALLRMGTRMVSVPRIRNTSTTAIIDGISR